MPSRKPSISVHSPQGRSPSGRRQDIEHAEYDIVDSLDDAVCLSRVTSGNVARNLVEVRERFLAKYDAHAVFAP